MLAHACEQKRRAMQRDDKDVKIGFMAYQRFFVQRMARRSRPPTYESFCKSSLYLAFVRFGRHVIQTNAINPMGFTDFLIKADVAIDNWTSPTVYETYVRELNKNELPVEALERTLLFMQQWATENEVNLTDFFRVVPTPLATLWIKSGRISPWILLMAPSASELMGRLSTEQADLVNSAVDADFWDAKMRRHKDAAEAISTELAAVGL